MGFLKKLRDKVTAPNCSIQLNLVSFTVTLGESIKGSLELYSREDFEANEIRCVIECIETKKVIKYEYDPALKRSLPREAMESVVVFAAKPILGGQTTFSNGETRSFPFSFPIPMGGKMSNQGFDNRVVWTIKGVVAVDGRPDINTNNNEIHVLAPAPQIMNQPVMKEIVREVVKIPCRYCQTLFDQLETSCPNCGAKRTI